MADITKIEYRVREVTKYIVTRYHETASGVTGGSEVAGEYANADSAYDVAYALAQAEHRRMGWPVGDPRIQYPLHPNDPTVDGVSARPCLEPCRVEYGI